MDYQTALAELKAGKKYPVYLLWGEETFLREDLLAKMKKQAAGSNEDECGITVLHGKNLSAESIIEAVDTVPFFSAKQLVIVENWHRWRADKQNGGEKPKPDEQRFIDYINDKIPAYSCLVFTCSEKVDKRKKLYRAVEAAGAVVELSPLKGRALERWMTQTIKEMGKEMEPDVLSFIISEAGTSAGADLSLLRQELTKIALYTGKRVSISKDDVQKIITRTPESSVFMLVDAVGQRQLDNALQLWEDLKVNGQEPLKLLNLLARQIRLIWQAKQLQDDGCRAEQIAEKIGAHPYVAQKAAAQGRNFTNRQLKNLLERIQEADWSVKSGRRDTETMMRLLIVSLCTGE